MSNPPSMSPEQLRAHLADTLAPLQLSPPSVATMQQRIRRRRHRYAATAAGFIAAIVTGGVVVPLALAEGTHKPIQVGIGSPTSGPSTPIVGPTAQAHRLRQACLRRVSHHTYLEIHHAHVANGRVTFIGRRITSTCKEIHPFAAHGPVRTYTLAPGATVKRFTFGSHQNPHDVPMSADELPALIKERALYGGPGAHLVYQFTGPIHAITQLIELYHP